jgi:biopolymer transport protein ExbD
MLRLRRTEHEMRIEIMPLIDVIFLLLTFFIYAMVLMQMVRMVPMQPQEFASGDRTTPAPAVTVSIDRQGGLFVDRTPIELDDLLPHLRELIDREPATEIFIVADQEGDSDRLPLFLELYDRIANAGLTIKLVGRPKPEPVQ